MWSALFNRIIWIPLRRLKGVLGLDNFFRQDYFSSQPKYNNLISKLRKTIFDQTQKRTLWLLDGLDEICGYRHISRACSMQIT
ncbi:hypothetical protein BDV59DRAFT_157722 [Aspergillus ambiguus]|uniref:uncharacterized protein n=1 Tax=Aspergillus ambiguus TaxID=176160 RepID=UPI003CCD028A